MKRLRPATRASQVHHAHYERLEPRKMLAAFSGTSGADNIIVTFVGNAPRFVEINGVVNDNLDSTASIEFLDGDDSLTLLGGAFDVTLFGVTSSSDGSGAVNGVLDFTFERQLEVATSNGNDTVSIVGSELGFSPIVVETGDGNDTVTYGGGMARIDQGAGDDLTRFTVGFYDGLSVYDGGEGFDTWEFVDVPGRVELRSIDEDGQLHLGFPCCFDGDPFGLSGTYSGMEKVIAPDPSTLGEFEANKVFVNIDRSGNSSFEGLNFVVDGSAASAMHPERTTHLELENFDSFSAGRDESGDPFEGTRLSILSTAFPLRLRNYDRMEVGFLENPRLGDTSMVSHMVDVAGRELVVSNYLGNASIVSVDSVSEFAYQVSGLTGASVRYEESISDLTLWSAKSAMSKFMVNENEARLTLYGGDLRDSFYIGGTDKRDLDLLHTRIVNVVGGGGFDVIVLDDSNSSGKNSYRMRPNWVFHSPDPRGRASRDFVGLWYTGIGSLLVRGNDEANVFRITPSFETQYQPVGLGPFGGDGDKLLLVGDVPAHQLFPAGSYLFGDTGAKPVRFNGFEQLTELGRVAAATGPGTNGVVEVFDEWSRHSLFTIRPYGPAFAGGISVATGYVLPGFYPAVATVRAGNGPADVKVYSGFNGSLGYSFQAFEGEVAGYDIAVGNVLGDHRNEIIVSKISAGNEIEIWEQEVVDNQTTWVMNRRFNPFASAPDVGARISVGGDFNFDGYQDIAAAAGPGWLPQVSVYQVDEATNQLHRFLAEDVGFRGGLYLSAGNLIGNRKSDIVVSSAAANGNGFPNVMRIFRGERLPTNRGAQRLAPDQTQSLFSGISPSSLTLRDTNLDLRSDQLFVATTGPNTSGQIKVTDRFFNEIDSLLTGEEEFLDGIFMG